MEETFDQTAVTNYLDRFVKKACLSSKMPLPEDVREPQFRVSSLPFCPITFLHDKVDAKNRIEPMDYSMAFYTGVGTVVHEVMQDYSPEANPKTFFGNWRCGRVLSREEGKGCTTTCRCSHTKTEISSYSQLKVDDCPHGHDDCKPYFSYHEVGISFHGLSGHVDAIIKRGDKFWVLDFKTTSSSLFGDEKDVQKMIDKGYYPSAKYITQIETYCALLEKVYGLDIGGYSICYVNRDKTIQASGYRTPKPSWRNFVYEWTDEKREAAQTRLTREIKGHNAAQAVLAEEDESKLDKHAERILKLKPCVNQDSYKKCMDHKWFGSEKCPFAGVCWQDDEAMKENIKEMAKELRSDED